MNKQKQNSSFMYVIYVFLAIIMFFILIRWIVKLFSFNKKETFRNNKFELGLLVIAKNENMVIREFVQHYQWQGVQHIYLIDNGSTDNTKQVLQPFIDDGYIEYYYMPKKHSQTDHYNSIYPHIKNQCKWLIVCDADEYIYNRIPENTIATYLHTLDYANVNGVALNWKMFGSSGYKQQPESIRSSFIMRKREDSNQKTIVNTSQTEKLIMHSHVYTNPNNQLISNPFELALNHYAIMSLEYFQKVKMTRGDAYINTSDNVRNMDYFARYDHKEMEDTELRDLVERSKK